MHRPPGPGRFAVLAMSALATSALALAGCATMNVSSYLERGIDFSQYQTYNWDSSAPQATGDPRLDSNPFFRERVQATADRLLAVRGFEKTASGTPQLRLHYHISVSQEIDVWTADARYAPSDNSGTPFVYDAGTLVLDLVDARTNKVIWRGWAKNDMDGVVDDQVWMEERIDKAVTRILERLPRTL